MQCSAVRPQVATKAATSYARKKCFALRAVGEVGSAGRARKARAFYTLFIYRCYELASKQASKQTSTPHQDEALGSELLSPLGNNADKHQQTLLPRRISKVGWLLARSFAHTWGNALSRKSPYGLACGVTHLEARALAAEGNDHRSAHDCSSP